MRTYIKRLEEQVLQDQAISLDQIMKLASLQEKDDIAAVFLL